MNKTLRRLSFAAAPVIAMLAFAGVASADLIYDQTILASAQGFGTAPRDLTLSNQGNNTTESGGIGVGTGGVITFGTTIADSFVFLRWFTVGKYCRSRNRPALIPAG